MNEEMLSRYADVLLDIGVNLTPGKNLAIQSEPAHWDFLVLLAEKAYKKGARYVQTQAVDPRASKARIDHQGEEYLDYVPPHRKDEVKHQIADQWCRIFIGGSDYPDLFKDSDPQRTATIQKALNLVHKPLMKASLAGTCRWVLAALPTPAWAGKVLDEKPSSDAAERLWEIMVPILRLDRDDPVGAWKEHAATLMNRTKELTDCGFEKLHFQGEGTDLTIGLIHGSRWLGGGLDSPEGPYFLPNLPTEEVFTTPDYRSTEGRVRVTRPVRVLGSQVFDAWFEFHDGKVVDFGAGEGRELLEKYLAMDEQAPYLGEVALVDSSSPIFKSGLVFENILYDENASCHIALGNGISATLPEANRAMDDDGLKKCGCNVSLVHTDFMIGSEKINVSGLKNGSKSEIIKDGLFVVR